MRSDDKEIKQTVPGWELAHKAGYRLFYLRCVTANAVTRGKAKLFRVVALSFFYFPRNKSLHFLFPDPQRDGEFSVDLIVQALQVAVIHFADLSP